MMGTRAGMMRAAPWSTAGRAATSASRSSSCRPHDIVHCGAQDCMRHRDARLASMPTDGRRLDQDCELTAAFCKIETSASHMPVA